MLYKFSFHEGTVNFDCKFLQSDAYVAATKTGKVQFKEWATDPCQNIFQRVKSHFVPPKMTDNGNINIIQYGDEVLATSETPLPIIFDPVSLKTMHHADYSDSLEGEIDPSHPHYDSKGNIYSYLLKYSLFSKYQVYRMDPDSMKREEIANIITRTPAYMHSFAMTENYIVLVEFPFIVRPLEMLLTNKPLIANYKWKPDLGTDYQVIHKETGEVRKFSGTPVFAFHHVNAFEENDELLIDMVCFKDSTIVETLYLDALRANEPSHAAGILHRATLSLKENKDVVLTELCKSKIELPRINYLQFNGKKYTYVYGAGNTEPGNWLDNITKIDTTSGKAWTWYEKHCYPSEPVFVNTPDGESEDDGVLLSVVLDSDAKNTFLLILNASDLSEIARAKVPEILPFSFHGNYFSEAQRGSIPNAE